MPGEEQLVQLEVNEEEAEKRERYVCAMVIQPNYRKRGLALWDIFPEDQAVIEDLFGTYQDAFAHSTSQLGRTSLVEHEINVGDNKSLTLHQGWGLSPVAKARTVKWEDAG